MQTIKEKAMYVLVAVHSFIESNPNSEAIVLSNHPLICQLVERYRDAKGYGYKLFTRCGAFEDFVVASKAKQLTRNTHITAKIAGLEAMKGQEHYNCDSDTLFVSEVVHGSGTATFYAPPKPKVVFLSEHYLHDTTFNSLSIARKIDPLIVLSRPWVNQGIFHIKDTNRSLSLLSELTHCFESGVSKVFLNCVPDEILFNALAWNLGGFSISENDMGMNIFPTWITEATRPIRSIHFAYTQRPSNIVFLKELVNRSVKWHPEKTLAGFRGSELSSVFSDAITEWRTIGNLIDRGEASEHTKRMYGWLSASLLWYANLWAVNDTIDDWFELPFRSSAYSDIAIRIREWMRKA